jgi:hypothetical protein
MSFLMTKVGLNVFFSINQSVSLNNIMVLLPYVSQLSNVTSQLKDIYGLHDTCRCPTCVSGDDDCGHVMWY